MNCIKWKPIEEYLLDKLEITKEDSNIDRETKNIVYLDNDFSYPIEVFKIKKNNKNWYIFEEHAKRLLKELKERQYTDYAQEIQTIITSNKLYLK